MKPIIILFGMLYVFGFMLTFYVNTQVAPNATLALITLRSTLWPVWVVTGHPAGTQMVSHCDDPECE